MKKLTLFESIALVAGAGVGTGLLTIPYAASKIGIFGTAVALICAYAISLILYFFIAQLTLEADEPTQLLGILKQHLFRGKHKKLYTGVFFAVFIVILLQNLIVYILCASDILTGLFGLPPAVSKVIFYALSTLVLIFGIKAVGIGEKIAVPLITLVIILLIVLAMLNQHNTLSLTFGSIEKITAVYGLFMFAFSAIFSVVQVVNHIENKKHIRKALSIGLGINAALTFLFIIATIIGSNTITQVATIGLTDSIASPVISIVCSVFVLLALATSYWSSGLAFADTLKDELKINKKIAWLLSTIPTIIIALVFPMPILDYVQIGAGALSIVLIIIILPAYNNAVKNSKGNLLLGKLAKSKVLLWLAGIFMLIMAVSSFIPID